SVVGAELVDRRDVRMVQGAGRLGLLLEPPQALFVRRVRRRKDLDRDVALQLGIPRAVHLTHTPGADRREDLVEAEPCSGCQRHRGWRILTASVEYPCRASRR